MSLTLKVCCIANVAEAQIALGHGATAFGLVSHMPSGPGVIAETQIAEVADWLPVGVASVLLTSETSAPSIIGQQRRCRVNTVQLVDAVEPGTYERLRAEVPGIKLIQVVHVTGPEAVEEALRVAPAVDALLLDSGDPRRAVKQLGGTARVHDWTVSREIVGRCGKPVFLAGGLTPENVGDAIAAVGPFGLDVCSGVRTNGTLDEQKLRRYVQAAAGVS